MRHCKWCHKQLINPKSPYCSVDCRAHSEGQQEMRTIIKGELALIALQYSKLRDALNRNDMYDVAIASHNIKGCAESINKLVNDGGPINDKSIETTQV